MQNTKTIFLTIGFEVAGNQPAAAPAIVIPEDGSFALVNSKKISLVAFTTTPATLTTTTTTTTARTTISPLKHLNLL